MSKLANHIALFCSDEVQLSSPRTESKVMDLFPNEQNFDLDKRRQRFYHSLKEHHKISNIPKFRCKML
jgi:hypothetical protein